MGGGWNVPGEQYSPEPGLDGRHDGCWVFSLRVTENEDWSEWKDEEDRA